MEREGRRGTRQVGEGGEGREDTAAVWAGPVPDQPGKRGGSGPQTSSPLLLPALSVHHQRPAPPFTPRTPSPPAPAGMLVTTPLRLLIPHVGVRFFLFRSAPGSARTHARRRPLPELRPHARMLPIPAPTPNPTPLYNSTVNYTITLPIGIYYFRLVF
jgi:hypothetical protein